MNKLLGKWEGAGLVMGQMIGAGVFLSVSLLTGEFTHWQMLLVWIFGAFLALLGCLSYGMLVRHVPKSGGEYQFIKWMVHPGLGAAAGWASIFVGFAAPAAVDALATAEYVSLLSGIKFDSRIFALVLTVVMTAWHALSHQSSRILQNVLVVIKVALVVGFVVAGFWFTGHQTWIEAAQLKSNAFPSTTSLMSAILIVSYAFTGWNAAVYVTEEFEEPHVNVPRAMLLGWLLVSILYIAVTVVLAVNYSPLHATGGITVSHQIANHLFGGVGATILSIVLVGVLASSMSTLIYAGARVVQAMAADGLFSDYLRQRKEKIRVSSVLFIGGLTLLLLMTQSIRELVESIGAILTLFAALSVAGMFFVRGAKRLTRAEAIIPALFFLTSVVLLAVEALRSPMLILWCVLLLIAGLLSQWYQRV